MEAGKERAGISKLQTGTISKTSELRCQTAYLEGYCVSDAGTTVMVVAIRGARHWMGTPRKSWEVDSHTVPLK